MKKSYVWFDGRLVESDKVRIDLLSHALHYGSGAYEGIRAYETSAGPAIFRLQDHVKRLFHSAGVLGIKLPYSQQTIERAIRDTVKKSGLRACYIRPIVFYGEGEMRLTPERAKVHVAVAVWPWGAYLGEHQMLSVGISPYVRFHPKSVVPSAKVTGFYAASAMATLDARRRGFNECVLLDYEGNVAEGPGENIFIVKGGKLIAVDSPSILRGITRATVIQIARDLRIPVVEKSIALRELLSADEAFLTGTAAEVAAVGKIDKKKLRFSNAIGPITEKIRSTYLATVHGEVPKYKKWLTWV